MEASANVPKVLYFKILGRAIKIRLLLKHAGINFVDEHPGEGDWKEWKDLKADFPERGGLPWYIDGAGKVWNQSDAVLRAIAKEAGYKSDDPWVQYECEWLFETIFDFNK